MQKEPNVSPKFFDNVARWARGEITWAQVEGFTSRQAREFAEAACDLARRGQLRKAAAIFEGLVAMNPFDHASRAALGTVYRRMGRIEDALQAFDHAIAVCADDVVALAHRGELKLQSDDPSGFDDLRRATDIDSVGRTAAARRARSVLASQGKAF